MSSMGMSNSCCKSSSHCRMRLRRPMSRAEKGSSRSSQRTALARACIASPRWLLLDEPFSALDIGLRSRMRQWLLDLQQELDIPMLLITHDPEDSEVLAQEVAHMEVGKLAYGVSG